MQCSRCHTPLPDEARFCISCGADVSDSGAGSTTAAMDAAASEQLLRLVKQEVGSEFEVERELGRGGMAVVYLATEVHLGRKVAIKVLPPELTFGSPGAIERFKREARTAATLDHPNIIPIYRVSPGGRLFWYAMKYLEGRSLADVLEEQRALSVADTIAILEQVASALDYAHARHVVHRDIKPANIMLDAQNRVIVTDFGIAKQLAAGAFTASGSVIGTPYYMSPEQCRGLKTITGAADQYSVGVMTYQMLCGQVPFEGDSPVDVLTKHVMQPPPPLDVLLPGLPKHVYQAIEKALAKKPEQRFPSVGTFVRALKEPDRTLTAPTVRRPSWSRWTERTTTPVPAPRPVRRRLAIPAAAVVAVALGSGALWLVNREWPTQGRAGTGPAADTIASRQATASPQETGMIAATPPVQGERRETAAGPQEAVPTRVVEPVRGRLTVAGLPRGGTVTLNGQRRSGSSFELEPGTYTVRLEAPGFEPVRDTTVSIVVGQTSRVTFRGTRLPEPAPQGAETTAAQPVTPQAQPPLANPTPSLQPAVLVIRTVGGWARIYIDGSFRREGTAHRDTLPPGTHTVRIEREGFITVDTTLTLRSGATEVLTISMRRASP